MMTPNQDVSTIVQKMFGGNPKPEYATVNRLLFNLLDVDQVKKTVQDLDGDVDQLRADLKAYVDKEPMLPFNARQNTEETPDFTRVFERALMQVKGAGRDEINGLDVLISIAGEPAQHDATALLLKQGITRLDLVNYANGHVKKKAEAAGMAPGELEDPNAPNPLDTYAVNLNRRAAEGKIDPLIGRDAVIERVVCTLARRRKNNPLLIGEPGVGKTAIAEGLAQRIVEGKVPPVLLNVTVYALDLPAMVAGAKYRGDFEKRLKDVMKKVENNPNAVLFIDEIHTLLGSGAAGGAMDGANILKPALASGAIKVIGATTVSEKRTLFDRDQALARRFQPVDVDEPSAEDAIKILMGLKPSYEKFHGVTYDEAAVQHAVHQSVRYLADRRLPDKAIDILDEAGATQSVAPPEQKRERISVNEIDVIIARMAKLPPKQVKGSDKARLRALPDDLRQMVYGQDEALDALVESVYKARAGLGAGGKESPQGSFLFTGPTGVGKTETARQLALTLNIPLLRFDMSEYQEGHSVARLIGAPPGYVGHDSGGLLTEAVARNPHAVVLLDEFEKAHPAVHNMLLQVMDHGALTDGQGRKVDFRNVILIITSNLGAEAANKRAPGFASFAGNGEDYREAEVVKTLAPEFRNRLDKIVNFKALTPDIMHRVVDKQLMAIEGDLQSKSVVMDFSQELRDKLAVEGYDEKMGARPLKRLISTLISVPLSKEMLFGRLEFGGEGRLFLNDAGEVTLDVIRSNPEPVDDVKAVNEAAPTVEAAV